MLREKIPPAVYRVVASIWRSQGQICLYSTVSYLANGVPSVNAAAHRTSPHTTSRHRSRRTISSTPTTITPPLSFEPRAKVFNPSADSSGRYQSCSNSTPTFLTHQKLRPSRMDELPPELLSHIAALCDYNTKLQFCSVNRYLRDVLCPLVFEHIYVGWNRDHMEHIVMLSRSTLAKHVRRVTVNTEILPPLRKRQWIERLYYAEAHQGNLAGRGEGLMLYDCYDLLLPLYSKDVLEADWKDFQNVAVNQQIFGHYIGALLGTALKSLPNVEHLEFIDKRGIGVNQPGSLRDRLALCSPWKDRLLDPFKFYDMLMSELENGDLEEEEDVSSAFALHHVADWDRILRANSRTTNICIANELTIEFGHHIPVSKVFEDTNCEDCESCRERTPKSAVFESVFRTLSKLKRVNIKASENQLQHKEAVCKEITSGLSKVTNLRHLTIDNRHTDCDFLGAFRGCNPVWPRLRRLRLSGVTSREHLLDFLSSTAESLRKLELVEMQLSEESGIAINQRPRWDDCLEKAGQILHLERACVRSLYYHGSKNYTIFFVETARSISEMNMTVERFLTGRADVLPRQETWGGVPTREALDAPVLETQWTTPRKQMPSELGSDEE